jgi:hypothetical protein
MEFTPEVRRARLVSRHHLSGTAADPVQAATDLLVVHASDPATVYLSLLARCPSVSLKDIAHVMYDERALVRMLAMRRTLFVVPQPLVPVVHHAASLDVAARIRRQLVKQLSTLPTEPQVEGDVTAWLLDVERGVEESAARRGTALANALSQDEPRLRTAFIPTTDKAWDVKRNVTSQVLTMMAAEGRLVRASPRGSWVSRQHTWEPASMWWPGGIEAVRDAKARLVELYLRRFGPATLADVQWWTGWTLGQTRSALASLDTVDVGCGLVMADDTTPDAPRKPTAALLPALDATPMGWKQREWYLPDDWQSLYDRNGNIGPTIWWGGEIIGGWSVRPSGEIATRLLVDRGKAAERAVAKTAAALHPRLEGAAVVPSFPTPLDKELRGA